MYKCINGPVYSCYSSYKVSSLPMLPGDLNLDQHLNYNKYFAAQNIILIVYGFRICGKIRFSSNFCIVYHEK